MGQSNLQKWISAEIVGDEMLWKGAWGHQMTFLRDVLHPLVGLGLDYEDALCIPSVISTHSSKSITLPVVQYERKDIGLKLIVRENFYNWKLSVISKTPINADFDGLFATTSPIDPNYTGNPLSKVYFEGFPEDLIFGYYAESDRKKWSAEIWGDQPMWTTVFLIMKSLGVVKPHKWHTPQSHKKSLSAEAARRKARESAKTPQNPA